MSTNEEVNNIRKARTEQLANFALEVFNRARELQREKTGLMSNETAIRLATWESFAKGVDAINNSIAHVKLFAGDQAQEQIQSMMDYASKQDSSASAVMGKLLEQFEPQPQPKLQKQEGPIRVNNNNSPSEQKNKQRETECVAP